jgi:monoamine oxidase
MTNDTKDVLVIGAGMAGLTAARALAEAGLHVVVLEAQDRIGGRILTHRVGDEVLELGAEFVHGRPPELWALIEEAGFATVEREGTQICFEEGALTDCDSEMEEIFKPLEDLKNFQGADISFAEYLDRKQTSIEDRDAVIGYVEGFNAADYREVSVAALGAQQKAEDAIEGDRLYHLVGGYDQLPHYLADRIAEYGGSIRLGEQVRDIRWRAGHVEAITVNESFTAQRAILAVPLAVLQSNRIAITPRPDAALAAAAKLRMGHVLRFTLLFRERFWENLPPRPPLEKLSFLFAFEQMPSVWWTPHSERSNSITGWVGGPRSAALEGLDADELGRRACATLAEIFSLDADRIQQQLLGCYTHDWTNDAFTFGAYSYVATGGLEASRQMTEPVENTLYFAGEHTDVTGHWGTVHAAIRSGLRAAAQIISA